MEKLYYALLNYYGNRTVGHCTLHVFESKQDRENWIDEDIMKRESVLASNSSARKFNGTWESEFRYVYHYADGTVSDIYRHDGKQYEEKRERAIN